MCTTAPIAGRRILQALALAAGLVSAAPLSAAPVRYALDAAASTVAFTYVLNGQPTEGRMPVAMTDIVLDFDRAANSSIVAELDVTQADAGLIFATEAMKDATVLDAAEYPVIRFESASVTPTPDGATLNGTISIRGVSKPITLDAKLFRQRGTEQGDRSRLTILMTGGLDRKEFGATGYPSLVGDRINISILARITRQN